MKHIPIIPVQGNITPTNTPMEYIIRPTEACNFKCTFCSSTQISEDHYLVLDLERTYEFLTRFPQTTTIIVNGGDPLMIKPEYYWKIIEFLDERDLPASISFTSNLWPFYKKPEKWTELFKHWRMGVTTSFHYGDTRLKGDYSVFTEDDFWKVSDAMLEHVGYRPDFISVITEENEDTAIDNVYLAKEMGVECKLNYAMASGDQGVPYQLSKIYEMYLKIHELGLTEWEFNTKQMIRRLSTGATCCPQARKCDENIRAINPGGDYYSCAAFADDAEKPIDYQAEIFGEIEFTPLQDSPELFALKDECVTCPMFSICNGCRKTVKDMKQHNIVEPHCKLMKTLAPKILELNFADQPDQLKRELERV